MRLAPEAGLRCSAALLALFALFGFNPQTLAATQTYVGSGLMNASTSWNAAAGPTPGPGDIALFNSSTPAATTVAVGASMTIGELQFNIPAGAVTIGGGSDAGVVLTLDGVANASNVLVGVDASTDTHAVTLGGAQDGIAVNASQSWFVDAGTTLTVAGALSMASASTQLTLGSGTGSTGGQVTLGTTADTFNGSIFVNSSVILDDTVAQGANASYYINNGGTFEGNQNLAAGTGPGTGNVIYANSGTSAIGSTGASATFLGLIGGNGNLNWSTGITNPSFGSTPDLDLFGNYGGTAKWGSSNAGIRIATSTGFSQAWASFANFDLGTSTGSLTTRDTAYLFYGGVQSEGTGSSIGGNSNGGGHDNVVVLGSANLTQTFEGSLLNGDGVGTEYDKVGTGAWTLTGADNGGTAVYAAPASLNAAGGTLNLGFTTIFTNIMQTTQSASAEQGGTFEITGNSGAAQASSQTLTGFIAGAGGGVIEVNPNGGGGTTFNLGALTDTAAGSTLEIQRSTAGFGSGTVTITTSTAKSADGTYGARVTFGNNWATTTSVSSPYTLSGYTGYNVLTSGFTGGTNTTDDQIANSTGNLTLTSNYTANSLDINNTSSQSLGLGGFALVLTNGGLLYGGSAPFTIGSSVGDGTLNSTPTDLVIQALGTGGLTINSTIINGSTLTVAGTGTVTLNGANTYTGATSIETGATVSITGNGNIGAQATGAALNLDGGTLQAAGATTYGLYNGTAGTNNRAVNLGGGGGTFDVTNGTNLTVAGVIADSTLAGTNNNVTTEGGLTKTDSGTLNLTGANTYLGATVINGGVLSTTTLANGGTASGIGESVATANALILNTGELSYTGAAATTTNRDFTVEGGSADLDASGGATDTVTFSALSPIWYAASGNEAITLSGANTGANTLDLGINDPGYVNSGYTGSTSLIKSGAGTWVINGIDTYSGGTTVSAGILQLGTGDNSALGSTTNSLTVNGGDLDLNSNSVTVGAFSGSGGSVESTTGGATLTVNQGTGITNTFGGTLINGGGTLSLTQAGGQTTLTGANTYTGATTVTTGTLALGSGGSLGATTVSAGAGATLLAKTSNGGISGNVSLASTSNLSLEDGGLGSLTIGGTLTLNGSTDKIDLDLLGGTGTDQITVNGGALLGTGNGVINIANLGGTAPANLTTYYFLTDSGGFGSDTFSLGTTAITIGTQAYDLSLVQGFSGTEEGVELTFASLNYYWDGNASSSWSNVTGNFAKATNGTQQQTSGLSSTSNVFLTDTSPTGGTYTQTLDDTYTVNSLSFTGVGTGAGSNSVILNAGSGGPLTIDAGNTFTDANGDSFSGVGLVVQPGAAADTINASIDLGASQVWDINNTTSTPLTVNGTIADGTTLDALTLTSTTSGEVVLGAANTYDGGTTITGNVTVKTTVPSALSSSGGLTVSGTGTLDLSGDNETVTALNDGGSSLGVITSSTGAATLTVNNSTASSYGGTLTDANNGSNGVSLGLTMEGSSTLTLSASNNYTGATTVTAGTLTASNNHSLGSATSTTGGLNMTPSAGTATVNFTSSTPSIASLASSGGGTSLVVLGNTASGGSPTTLTIGQGGQTTTFNGSINDNSGLDAPAIGSLVLDGGQLTLANTDAFTGTTVLDAGTLVIDAAGALENSLVNYNGQGGTLTFGTATAATFGALEGDENIALTNATPAAVALTVGGNGDTETYSGVLSGAGGSLTKNGGGTLNLSGSNIYTGSTTVNGGILNITSTGAITGGAINLPGGNLTVNGGTVTSSASSAITDGFILNSGTAEFNGGITSPDVDGALVQVNGGTFTATTVNMSRSLNLGVPNATTFVPPGGVPTGSGFVVTGGTATVTSIDLPNGTNSSANAAITGGVTTVTGNFILGFESNTRYSYLEQTGGNLTVDGIMYDGQADGGDTIATEIYQTAGVSTFGTLDFGAAADTVGGESNLLLSGGTMYIGAGGINDLNTDGLVVDVLLNTATVGAAASWSSSVPIQLFTSGDTTTFQAADSLGNANNITLTGGLTGAGGLTKTGNGILTLATTVSSYTGATTVNAGTMIVSGGLSGSAVTANAGGTFEADSTIVDPVTLNGGTLQGTGTVGGVSSNVSSDSTLAPGLTVGSTTPGQLTASGAVTLQTGDTFSIRVGVAASTDSDSLNIGTNTLTLNGATLAVNTGAFANGATADQLYDIVVGTGAGNTVGTFDFGGNPLTNGAEFTTNTNYTYQIFYNVAGGNVGTAGNDDVLELVSIPEPGTWASLLGGLGMLIVWQRSRRRRQA
jgi:autotransporter-associated beta strand protein